MQQIDTTTEIQKQGQPNCGMHRLKKRRFHSWPNRGSRIWQLTFKRSWITSHKKNGSTWQLLHLNFVNFKHSLWNRRCYLAVEYDNNSAIGLYGSWLIMVPIYKVGYNSKFAPLSINRVVFLIIYPYERIRMYLAWELWMRINHGTRSRLAFMVIVSIGQYCQTLGREAWWIVTA